MATRPQLALIHIAKKDLENKIGFTDCLYRDLLWSLFKVDSSKNLDYRQARELLEHFEKLGWEAKKGERKPQAAVRDTKPLRPPPDPKGTISPDQQVVIEGLREFLGWYPHGLRKFCLARFGFAWPQTRQDGQKVIFALISIGAEKMSETIRDLDRDSLTPWETGFLFTNEKAAQMEFERYVNARGKRGQRKMPEVSITKLLEIIKKRKITW